MDVNEPNRELPRSPQAERPEVEERTEDMLINIGPSHPAMHGIIRIITRAATANR